MSNETVPISFAYHPPTESDRCKEIVRLATTDILHAHVQVINKGGENNLHSHARQDGFWFVLNGGCRFYTSETEVLEDYRKHEGVVIPRGVSYWFESIGSEQLELLHVVAMSEPGVDLREDRLNRAPLTKAGRDLGLVEP